MRSRASAVFVVVIGALLAFAPPGSARADDSTPYVSSSATRYQVTFAARSCPSYQQITAGQIRTDDAETLGRPGRDNPYRPGQPVDVGVEDTLSTGCTPLPGWTFTLGSGHERKGQSSTVTGRRSTTPATADSTPRRDFTGNDTGRKLAGAVTVALTDEQVGLAARRQLWVQGGSPDKPVGDGYAFGALRCAVDGRTPGNVQWLAFPPGSRHVFCYAYYVKGAGTSGTVTVRLRTTRPIGYPQRVQFTSGLSNTADGGFALASSGEQVEAAFTRAPAVYQVQPRTPAGWRLAGAACAGSRPDGKPATSRSAVDATTGTAAVTLAAGDAVVCTYSMEPPAPTPGLRLRLLSPGAGGAFGLTLVGAGQQRALTATTDGGEVPVPTSGADLATLAPTRYTVTVAPPAGQAAQWTLLGALCNGAPATAGAMTVTFDLAPGVGLDCVLRLARKPPTVSLAIVTAGGVATAAFAVVPADHADPGWWAAANTTGYGVPAPASGDIPRDLPFGTYLITAVPPRSTSTTGWRLSALRCDAGDAATADSGTVRVTVTPDGPDRVCTAGYEAVPATRLQVTLRAKGAQSVRQGPAVVEVSCVDGSSGRLVLGPRAEERATLPEPLAFLEPTKCTVSQPATGAASTGAVKVSAVREPSTGDGPFDLPAELAVARDVGGYTVAVTDEFSAPTVIATRASFFDQVQSLPVVLVTIGLSALGGLVLLGIFLRHRAA